MGDIQQTSEEENHKRDGWRGDKGPVHIKKEENRKRLSPNKQDGWRGRSTGRGRGSGRGRGGQNRPEVDRESALNYYPNGDSTEASKSEGKWQRDRGKDRERRREDSGSYNRGIEEKINSQSGHSLNLTPLDITEKKFNGRNRLYIANTGPDVTEEEITTLFEPYGETNQFFLNKEKNFAFVTFDFHTNAVRAKNDLDGKSFKGRNLKIRFSSSVATIKVKNLNTMVTSELLHLAFSPFGEIDEAKVSVDHHGKPTGEGFVHFARKTAALSAVRACSDGCYFLTTSLQPVIAEMYEYVDNTEGYLDKVIDKKSYSEFLKEREVGPRFAKPDSFEFEYGQRWKALLELYSQKEKAVKNELQLEKEKLIAQMEYAKYEHETEMLRNALKARELDKERQKKELEMIQKQAEEEQARSTEAMKRYQQQLESKYTRHRDDNNMWRQEQKNPNDLWRQQQENSLYQQAHNLDSLLEQTERNLDENLGFSERVKQERPGHWVDENADERSFPKRRRF